MDPSNGPLMMVGVRSQMSSVGKNVLTYYQDIVGECISLQDRFPMCTYGYAYLHPLHAIKEGKTAELIDHRRYARLYEAISGRDGRAYAQLRGVYDEFAYLVVDFDKSPPELRDDIVQAGAPRMDLRIATLVDRLVDKFASRAVWLDVFTAPATAPAAEASTTPSALAPSGPEGAAYILDSPPYAQPPVASPESRYTVGGDPLF
jgi:hypothetical protein